VRLHWTSVALSLAMFVLGPRDHLAYANENSNDANWKSRFLTESPTEWSRIEGVIGHLQGTSSKSHVYFATKDHSKPPAPWTHRVSFFFNSQVDGVKIVASLVPDNGSQAVYCSNLAYDFELLNSAVGQKPYLSDFVPVSANNRHAEELIKGRNESLLFSVYVAETLCSAKMRDLINGPSGWLKSLAAVEVNGKQYVRLSFDRQFSYTHKLYPCWAIVDPHFHWAITQYEQQDEAIIFRATVEYQPEITDIAFPKRIVEEELDLVGDKIGTSTMDFSKPQRCYATAQDFTLQAFGLEPPKSGFDLGAPPPATQDSDRFLPSEQSRAGGPVASGSSSAYPHAVVDSGIAKFLPPHLAIWAAGFGGAFYLLFLWSRRNKNTSG